MTFLTETELRNLGFQSLGKNVLISDRASLYGTDSMSIGNDCRIDDFACLSGQILMKNNVHIANSTTVIAGTSLILFDDFSGLSSGCRVYSQTDDYSGSSLTNPTVPKSFRNVFSADVKFGRHVIIGTNSVILPGVEIGDGAAVAAMSLVNKNLDSWGIYAGIPVRKIKERKRDLLELETSYLNSIGAPTFIQKGHA